MITQKEASRQIKEANMRVAEKEVKIQKLILIIRDICCRRQRYDWCCAYCIHAGRCVHIPHHWCEDFEV